MQQTTGEINYASGQTTKLGIIVCVEAYTIKISLV